jgi:hypothetical protein
MDVINALQSWLLVVTDFSATIVPFSGCPADFWSSRVRESHVPPRPAPFNVRPFASRQDALKPNQPRGLVTKKKDND